MDVTVRSFFPGGLAASHVEFVDITNLGVDGRPGTGDAFEGADSTICNSDPVPRNLTVGGTSLSAALGLYRYGQLLANVTAPASAPPLAADTARWKFKNPGGIFKFQARLLAEPCSSDCTPGRGVNAFWQAEGGTGSLVNAVAEGDGVVYLGGSFTYVGPRTGGAVVVNGSSTVSATPGTLVAGPGLDGGDVLVALPDGSGGTYLGGAFTSAGGVARRGLVRVDGAGQLDVSFVSNVNGTVRALALTSSGDLVVGGLFTDINGVSRTNLALVDATTGGVDSAWRADANGQVNALVASAGRLFAGGSFTSITDAGGAVGVDRLARLDEASGAVNVAFTAVGASATVNALALGAASGAPENRSLVVGGAFTQFRASNTGGLTARQRLAFVDVDNLELKPASFTIGSDVTAVAANGTDVFLGGSFTTVNGLSRLRSALVTEAGAVSAWRPFLNDTVFAIALDLANGQVYLGGAFTARAVAVNAVSGATVAWPVVIGPNNGTSGVLSAVRAIAAEGASVLLGGSFRSVGGVPRRGAAALDLSTGEATEWTPFAVAQTAFALDVLSDNDVIIGTSTAVQRVDGTTGATTWLQPVSGGAVRALAHDDDGNVYVGGAFTSLAATARGGLAAVADADGSLRGWTANVNVGGVVRGIAVFRGEVFVGGDFTSLSGSPGLDFGVVNSAAASGPATVRRFWSTNSTGRVNSISAGRDGVFVGGFFATLDGVSRTSLAAVDGANVVSFSANANQEVDAVAAVGNNLLVAGNQTSLAAQPCARACAVNVRGVGSGIGSANLSSRATTLAAVAGQVVIGGGFTSTTVNAADARTGVAVISGE
jgi:hypothetical protein